MTTEIEVLVVVSDFSAGHYLNPPDFSDPKSPIDDPRLIHPHQAARNMAIKQQRNAQSARYRQRRKGFSAQCGSPADATVRATAATNELIRSDYSQAEQERY